MTADTLRVRVRRSVFQAVALLIAGAVCAAAFHVVRPGGLPWTRSGEAPRQGPVIGTITPLEAWSGFQRGEVQFVDARPLPEFLSGHLPGAWSVPVERANESAGLFRKIAGKDIVVYCSDPGCHLSSELASLLSGLGVRNIVVMPAGWMGWYDAGLPAEGQGGG